MAEYDDFGAQLDELTKEYSALKAPGLFQEKKTPGAISTYKLQREALAQRIADMKRKYEASLGDVRAVTGRVSGGFNAPLVPALRFDAPQQFAPSVSTGQDFEQVAAPISTGALATVGQPRVRPKKKGVFADYQPSFGGAQESDVAMPLAAEPQAAQPAPAAAQAAPAAPQKGLREEYMERLAAMSKQPDAKMTEQQKGQALLEAGLAIMAAASKPGASALGAVGEGGMKGTAVARETEKSNRAQAERRRAEDIAALHTEMTLAGQDQTRADTKEERAERHKVDRERIAREEKRDTATADYNKKHLDLLKQKLGAGEVEVVKSDETGTLIILNKTTNEKKNTGIKFKREDGRPAEVQLLDSLMSSPSRMAAYKEIKGEKGGITNKDIFNKAFETTVAQVKEGSQTPIDQLLQQNTDLARRAAGFATGTGTIGGSSAVISRADPKYQEALRDPRIGGNQAKLDEQLKKAGKRVVD